MDIKISGTRNSRWRTVVADGRYVGQINKVFYAHFKGRKLYQWVAVTDCGQRLGDPRGQDDTVAAQLLSERSLA